MRRVLSSHVVVLLLLSVLAFGSLGSIFQEGMFTGHDIWHQVARLHHFSEAINSGQIMPTWVAPLAHGYGYPLFYFSYHFPWLVALPFLWSGLTVFETLKLLFFVAFLLAAFSMYWSLFLLTKSKTAAFAGSLIYLISPHHLFSVFVSASIGTVFQFIFIPLIFSFTTLLCLYPQKSSKLAVLLALSISASILSHFMSFVFVAPFIGLYALSLLMVQWYKTGKFSLGSIVSLVSSVLIVSGLVAYYILPMLQLLPLINASGDDAFTNIYTNNFADFKQLVYSPWGYGPIISNAKDGEVSLQVGVIQWLGVIGGLVFSLMLASRRLHPTFQKLIQRHVAFPEGVSLSLVTTYLVLFAATIFLMVDASKPIWNWVVGFFALDYPFRYLLLSVFFSSFIFGLVVSSIRMRSVRIFLVVSALTIAWYTNRNHMNPNMFTDFSFKTYIDSETTTNTFHEYLPRAANGMYLSKPQPIATSSSELTIEQLEITPRGVITSVTKQTSGEVALHQFDFPGQRVYINGELVNHNSNSDGLITVTAPQGVSIIKTVYENTPVYNISLLISALTLAYCTGVLINKGKQTQ